MLAELLISRFGRDKACSMTVGVVLVRTRRYEPGQNVLPEELQTWTAALCLFPVLQAVGGIAERHCRLPICMLLFCMV